jgi:hypothetical protein
MTLAIFAFAPWNDGLGTGLEQVRFYFTQVCRYAATNVLGMFASPITPRNNFCATVMNDRASLINLLLAALAGAVLLFVPCRPWKTLRSITTLGAGSAACFFLSEVAGGHLQRSVKYLDQSVLLLMCQASLKILPLLALIFGLLRCGIQNRKFAGAMALACVFIALLPVSTRWGEFQPWGGRVAMILLGLAGVVEAVILQTYSAASQSASALEPPLDIPTVAGTSLAEDPPTP